MRRTLAQLLALATAVVIVVACATFAWSLNSATALQQESTALDPAKIERGMKVFAAERCSTCHAIGNVGNRRYPLDGVGSRLSREAIETWIVAPQKMNPRVRKRAYELTPEDLDGLVTYLLSLREPKA